MPFDIMISNILPRRRARETVGRGLGKHRAIQECVHRTASYRPHLRRRMAAIITSLGSSGHPGGGILILMSGPRHRRRAGINAMWTGIKMEHRSWQAGNAAQNAGEEW